MTATASFSGFDGSGVDGSWYLEITNFARDTSWFNSVAELYCTVGFLLFVPLIAFGWWQARRDGDAATMAAVLSVPVALVAAIVVNKTLKAVVAERRPCRAYPHAYLIEECPSPDNYAFPSNHTVSAAALAAALLVVGIRLGLIGWVLAVFMGFARIYVGAHYPHDVAAGLFAGELVGFAVAWTARRYAPGLVLRLSAGPLQKVLLVQPPPRVAEHDPVG